MRILIAPLDWGLGHATRCVPLIRALRAAGHDVTACASGAGLRLLRAEFPDLETRELSSYAMRYTRRRALLPIWLLLQLPLFLLSVLRDRASASRLARELGADALISDGRYGFRARGIRSVFVTHQLTILPPGPPALRAAFAPAIAALNGLALRGFGEVWVPDFPDRALSGILGEPRGAALKAKARFIYPLCRFRPEDLPWDRPLPSEALEAPPEGPAEPLDVLALLSGPEPQRSLLEARLVAALATLPGTHAVVRGVPGTHMPSSPILRPGAVNVFDHLPQERLLPWLSGARGVVCRSGYTTVMELAGLGRGGVLLVPTPGQPEQEYLAIHAQSRGLAAWQDQDALDLVAGLKRAAALPGFGLLFAPDRTNGEQVAPSFSLAAWMRGF